ncbi:CLIP-associated protein, partial [Trifolium medium]|nr:CLIP-associated protein [Trifolium medium]
IVGRLSQEELMAQLPSFLPALFEAFGNQSADIRKLTIPSTHPSLQLPLWPQASNQPIALLPQPIGTFYRTSSIAAAVTSTILTVVFCLVDIYIMLGKAFLPYLEGLNSTQLKLVTIYANRISHARTGKSIDAAND